MVNEAVMQIIHQYLDHKFSWRTSKARIEWIVVHYSGIVSAHGQAAVVERSIRRSERESSTHYIVGEDGIIQIVRDKHRAWHVGGYCTANKCRAENNNSLGVDLVERKRNTKSGSVKDRDWYFTDKVINDGAQLVAMLADKYSIPQSHIVRHFDVTGKWCPRPFVGKDTNEITGDIHEIGWFMFKERVRLARRCPDEC